MIYVNQKQLDQVEYLIEQSSRGHHILFDADTIHKVFGGIKGKKIPEDLEKSAHTSSDSEEDNEAAEKHIENLILQPTLISKRAYLESLNPEMLNRVVRTYFSIVENNIFEALKFCQ